LPLTSNSSHWLLPTEQPLALVYFRLKSHPETCLTDIGRSHMIMLFIQNKYTYLRFQPYCGYEVK